MASSSLRLVRPFLLSGLIVVIDQLTKALITRAFQAGESVPLIGSLMSLTYVQNTGAAFGLFKGAHGLFVGLASAIIVWILWELVMNRMLPTRVNIGFALVLGGAIGNLIDRLRVGYVIDFIDVHFWPVFNVGDSAITIGVILLLFHTLMGSGQQR